MLMSPNADVLVGGAVVGGVVILLQVLKPYILPTKEHHPAALPNGSESKIKVLEAKVDTCEQEILGLRKRCHELGNFVSELHGRIARYERH